MPIAFEIRDRVALITVDDGRANALTPDLITDLVAAFDQAAEDPEARSIVLAGRPGRFCAGFDLAIMSGGADAMRSLVKAGGFLARRIFLEPRPVVAACTGHALAAGALLLLAADRRVGAAGPFKIGLNEVSIGMPLPKWGTELARYRLRPADFDWRAVLGQVGNPDEAVAAGFLDQLADPEQVLGEALAMAGRLAELRTGAVGATKDRARGDVAARMVDRIDEDLAAFSVGEPA